MSFTFAKNGLNNVNNLSKFIVFCFLSVTNICFGPNEIEVCSHGIPGVNLFDRARIDFRRFAFHDDKSCQKPYLSAKQAAKILGLVKEKEIDSNEMVEDTSRLEFHDGRRWEVLDEDDSLCSCDNDRANKFRNLTYLTEPQRKAKLEELKKGLSSGFGDSFNLCGTCQRPFISMNCAVWLSGKSENTLDLIIGQGYQCRDGGPLPKFNFGFKEWFCLYQQRIVFGFAIGICGIIVAALSLKRSGSKKKSKDKRPLKNKEEKGAFSNIKT